MVVRIIAKSKWLSLPLIVAQLLATLLTCVHVEDPEMDDGPCGCGKSSDCSQCCTACLS